MSARQHEGDLTPRSTTGGTARTSGIALLAASAVVALAGGAMVATSVATDAMVSWGAFLVGLAVAGIAAGIALKPVGQTVMVSNDGSAAGTWSQEPVTADSARDSGAGYEDEPVHDVAWDEAEQAPAWDEAEQTPVLDEAERAPAQVPPVSTGARTAAAVGGSAAWAEAGDTASREPEAAEGAGQEPLVSIREKASDGAGPLSYSDTIPTLEPMFIVDRSEEHQHVMDIEGIGPRLASRLNAHGIVTVPQLLRSDPERVARVCDMTVEGALALQSQGALMQLAGIGPQYAELLVAAGIKTTRDLAQADAQELAGRLQRAQAGRKVRLQGANVTPARIQRWIDTAGKTPVLVS